MLTIPWAVLSWCRGIQNTIVHSFAGRILTDLQSALFRGSQITAMDPEEEREAQEAAGNYPCREAHFTDHAYDNFEWELQ
jgi:hypothetical protein